MEPSDRPSIPLAVLRRLWPHGDQHVVGLLEGIAAVAPSAFPKYGLTTPLVIAHAMAQFSEECGAGEEMIESLNYSAEGLMRTWPTRFSTARAARYAHNPKMIADATYGGRMGNAPPPSDDGWNFRGRGLSQLTGRESYEKLGATLGLDLVNNPGLVNDPEHALECAVADFVVLSCCLPFAEKDDLNGVTHALNGGYIGLADRKTWLAKWKKELLS
jgi:putative chitinase